MRSKRDSLILSALIVSVLLIASVSAFWPFTGNAVDSGSRPLIVSVSPDESVRNASVHEQISFSFTAADMDSDMNHIWMQVWKAPSTSNPADFVTPESGYNNPNGFYTGAPQGVQTASSNIFTFSLSTPGTYYIRFAVRDIASPMLTEAWKTVNVGGKGSTCGAQDQCSAGLTCTNRVCNDPSSSQQLAGICQTCDATKPCASGMFCDSGVCKYNPSNIGGVCVKVSRSADSSNLCTGTYSKPCAPGLTCKYSEFWANEVGFDEGICQKLNVQNGEMCDANNICSSGLRCDESSGKCIIDAPIIRSFFVSNPNVVQGTKISVSIKASKASNNLKWHRLYVEGANGGKGSEWTSISPTQTEVTLTDSIATENNSKSFFRGAGLYNLVYEINDSNGNMASRKVPVLLADNPGVLSVVYGSGDVVTLSEGQTISVRIQGRVVPVSISFISTNEVILSVAGVVTSKLHEGDVQKIGGGASYIEIKDIAFDAMNGGISKVTFSIKEYSLDSKYIIASNIGVFQFINESFESGANADVVDTLTQDFSEFGFVDGESAKLMVNTPSGFNKDAAIAVAQFSQSIDSRSFNSTRMIVELNNAISSGQNVTYFYTDSGQFMDDGSRTGYTVITYTEWNAISAFWISGDKVIFFSMQDFRALADDDLMEEIVRTYLLKYPSTFNASFSASVSATAGSSVSSTQESNSSSTFCNDGCISPSGLNCYPAGHRTGSTYCDIDAKQMTAQKESGSACNNNFECSSNVCAASQCIDAGLLQRILNWFRGLGNQ